jgi:hypothetical protein
MRLISWTLQSGSKQFIYNWKTGKKNTDLDQGNEAAQRNGQEEPRKNRYIYREGI